MIKRISIVLAAIAGLALAAPAAAQMVRGQDPQSVVNALQAAGYRAELTKDNTGDPMINSTSSGTNFLILFFGCTRNVDCRTVQFFAGYTDPANGSISAMNTWNSENRFAHAYRSSSGAARIEFDVDLDDGGMSRALFTDNLEFWVALMAKFETYVAGK